ncbi:MAG: hypothetical protein Q9227_007180 [Pyrenula ochraceoflavens]
MGGDVLAGTTFVEALPIFEQDENTEGIILVGEVGGRAEEEAAEWIMKYKKRVPDPKPVMAIVGGINAPRGRVMGHAGAWAAPGEADAADKVDSLREAGVVVVDHPEKFGEGMKRLLAQRASSPQFGSPKKIHRTDPGQRRSFHSFLRRYRAADQRSKASQTRSLYIKQLQAFEMLREQGVPCLETSSNEASNKGLELAIDRVNRSPCILASTNTHSDISRLTKRFALTYGSSEPTSDATLQAIADHLSLPSTVQPDVSRLIASLLDIFMSKEAFVLSTTVSVNINGTLQVDSARFGFDDAAYRSSGRQASVHALRDTSLEVREEVEAEKHGIIYVKLDGPGTIGTLVNGAGLAMNTVDALINRGGFPANFVDTGGKATSETIKGAFEIISSDPRVKVIFVNIFGGLTRAEMIAEGILLAFKDLNLQLPVVVRLRGTNEALGQEVIRKSGLKVDAFDGFEDAAKRAIEIAKAHG